MISDVNDDETEFEIVFDETEEGGKEEEEVVSADRLQSIHRDIQSRAMHVTLLSNLAKACMKV